ncbi:hypothetical protein EDD85DRAFT_116647 [Armillaria nabsnona]|nr:hypothetical protein EDD85DRAFT_116647 [Armillaria nabsnona]
MRYVTLLPLPIFFSYTSPAELHDWMKDEGGAVFLRPRICTTFRSPVPSFRIRARLNARQSLNRCGSWRTNLCLSSRCWWKYDIPWLSLRSEYRGLPGR